MGHCSVVLKFGTVCAVVCFRGIQAQFGQASVSWELGTVGGFEVYFGQGSNCWNLDTVWNGNRFSLVWSVGGEESCILSAPL